MSPNNALESHQKILDDFSWSWFLCCVKISWICIWILGAFVQQCAMVWKDFLSCSCYISCTVVSYSEKSKIRKPFLTLINDNLISHRMKRTKKKLLWKGVFLGCMTFFIKFNPLCPNGQGSPQYPEAAAAAITECILDHPLNREQQPPIPNNCLTLLFNI